MKREKKCQDIQSLKDDLAIKQQTNLHLLKELQKSYTSNDILTDELHSCQQSNLQIIEELQSCRLANCVLRDEVDQLVDSVLLKVQMLELVTRENGSLKEELKQLKLILSRKKTRMETSLETIAESVTGKDKETNCVEDTKTSRERCSSGYETMSDSDDSVGEF